MQGNPKVTLIERCLSCGSDELDNIISFGETPIADHLLEEGELGLEEIKAPLDLQYCRQCSLVQLGQSLDPGWMFDDSYPYFSSVTKSLLEHSKKTVTELIKQQGLDENSLVVEIACNDGYLLQYFQQASVPVLGIDPSPRQSQQAKEKGIEVLSRFFNKELASTLLGQGRQADVIIANNVLAHVPELNDFVAGIACLLAENGLLSIEVPYVVDLVENLEFDTVYHQHLCYFSVTALDLLFRRHGLYINNLCKLSIHGGSLRVYVGKQGHVSQIVRDYLFREQALGVGQFSYYLNFARGVRERRQKLVQLLSKLKYKGSRIAAYGAAAKGNTLLSYCGIGKDIIDYVVDRNPHKQGLFMSGSCLPIYPVEYLCEDQPDFVLLLAWNISEEVLKQQMDYRKQGGSFILPVPDIKII